MIAETVDSLPFFPPIVSYYLYTVVFRDSGVVRPFVFHSDEEAKRTLLRDHSDESWFLSRIGDFSEHHRDFLLYPAVMVHWFEKGAE